MNITRPKLSTFALLMVLVLPWATARVTSSTEKLTPSNSDLCLEPSSTAIPGGKASLTVSVLTRKAATYIGSYQFKVSPYFFKSEKGQLTIDVSDEILKQLGSGLPVGFTGLAVTSGSGKSRRVNGKATPSDRLHGKVNLRFMADDRELVFDTAYRFNELGEQPR